MSNGCCRTIYSLKVFCIYTTRQLNDDECELSSKLLGEYFILSGVYSGVPFKKIASPYILYILPVVGQL